MNLGRKLAADPVLTQPANRERHGCTNAGPQIGSKPFELVMRLDVNSHARTLHATMLTRSHTAVWQTTVMTISLIERRGLSSRTAHGQAQHL